MTMTTVSARCVPSKRLKNWHRRYGEGCSLKWYARQLIAKRGPLLGIAQRWFSNKAGAS